MGAETASVVAPIKTPMDRSPDPQCTFADSETIAVLFDAVGTLIYPEPPVRDVYWRAGVEMGSRLTRDEVAARFRRAIERHFGQRAKSANDPSSELTRPPTNDDWERHTWRAVVRAVFADVDAERQTPLFDRLWQHFAEPQNWAFFDDVADVWRGLENRGMLVGVASNFDSRLHAVLRQAELTRGCQHVFASANVGFSKPDPRFFAEVARRLNLPPDRIVLVGDDRTNDMDGATHAGWQAVFVDRSGSTSEAWRDTLYRVLRRMR